MSETMTETDTPESTPSDDGGGADIDIFAVADDGPKTDADGKPVMPDWVPGPQFWDAEKGEVRVQDMAKSWRDLRGQVSKGGKASTAAPEKETDYELPQIEDLPEGIVGGEKDTLWPQIRAAAHKAGISKEQLAAVARPYLEQLKVNLKEHQARTDPEAQREQLRQELTAELAKLGPRGKEMALDVRGWLNGLESSGKFTADEVLALKGVSTAAGVRALQKMREMAGGMPVPIDGLSADDASQQDGQRILTEGYSKGDPALIAKGRKILGDLEKAGKLRPL